MSLYFKYEYTFGKILFILIEIFVRVKVIKGLFKELLNGHGLEALNE